MFFYFILVLKPDNNQVFLRSSYAVRHSIINNSDFFLSILINECSGIFFDKQNDVNVCNSLTVRVLKIKGYERFKNKNILFLQAGDCACGNVSAEPER